MNAMTRKMFLLALFAIVSCALCRAQYRIYGHVPNLEAGTMYLEVSRGMKDSAKVENGCFTLESKTALDAPTYVCMHHSNNNWRCMFWMGNDNIDFTTVDDLPVIKGSKTNDEYQEYLHLMEPLWEEGRKLMQQAQDDVTKFDSIQHILDHVFQPKQDSLFMIFAKSHPASQITLNTIYNMRGMYKRPFREYKPFLDVLTPGAFKGRQWDTMCEWYEKDLVLEPGHPMPPFAMPDVYGKTIDVAKMKGKYVLLTLSNYGLKDYDSDLLLRKSLYEKYHVKGLEMVDYSLSSDLINVIKAPANFGLRWHFVTDYKGFDSPWFKEHAIDHVTQNFLIDPNGTIIGRNLFGEELEREIKKLFN